MILILRIISGIILGFLFGCMALNYAAALKCERLGGVPVIKAWSLTRESVCLPKL